MSEMHNTNVLKLQVYHEDYMMKTCNVIADPHLISFDGVWYDSHSEGTFIYAISDDGSFEVRMISSAILTTIHVVDRTHLLRFWMKNYFTQSCNNSKNQRQIKSPYLARCHCSACMLEWSFF